MFVFFTVIVYFLRRIIAGTVRKFQKYFAKSNNILNVVVLYYCIQAKNHHLIVFAIIIAMLQCSKLTENITYSNTVTRTGLKA